MVRDLGGEFPEIGERMDAIMTTLDKDEKMFAVALERGEAKFAEYAHDCSTGVLPGALVWKLYETFGFPEDLT